jgi:uncharacterized protein YecE (DUF72 family)
MANYIGTSGWSYDPWQGILYPDPTTVGKRLGFYLACYNTVEVNSTYYRWPPDGTFEGWREKLPDGFVMTVKAPRGLTHYARLNGPEEWIRRICAGIDKLGDRLGILLIQLPPRFGWNQERLAGFLEQVPSWVRMACEFRDPSWHREEVFQLLEQHRAAYVVMSGAQLPCILRATAPFVYVRFHGPDTKHLYAGSYSDDDMRWWSGRVREWNSQGRDVYAYFNNDPHGHALRNADTLKSMLGP